MFWGLSIWSLGDYFIFGVQGINYGVFMGLSIQGIMLLVFRGLFIWSSGDCLFGVQGIIYLEFRGLSIWCLGGGGGAICRSWDMKRWDGKGRG